MAAGKVEEIKAAARKSAEDQVAAAAKASNEEIKRLMGERDSLQGALYSEKVGGSFSRSKLVAEKVAVPSDMLQAMFGQRFKVENGKTVGYGVDGQPIYSRARAGEIADFDEALESMVDSYANRDSILKGTGSSGSGKQHGNGGGAPGGKTISRQAYEAIPIGQRGAALAGGVKGID